MVRGFLFLPLVVSAAADESESFNRSALFQNSNQCITSLDHECGGWGNTPCEQGATCQSNGFLGEKHCVCNPGTCAGLDDRCHEGNYQRLDGTYKISSVRFPDHYVFMGSGFGQADISFGSDLNSNNGDAKEFYISVIPPSEAQQSLGLGVLLISKKYPNYVLAIDKHKNDGGTYYDFDSEDFDEDAEVEHMGAFLFAPPVENPSPLDATMVMIRGIKYHEYAYVTHGFGKGISADDDDKGAGMYFYISPPLPASLTQTMHRYYGERCDHDCGYTVEFASVAQSLFTFRGALWAYLLVLYVAVA